MPGQGWYLHMTLAMAALAYLTVLCAQAGDPSGVKTLKRPRLWIWRRQPPKVMHIIGWSLWRRRHQAVAKACRYRRRRQQHNPQL
jgi:hypothetical protein